MVNIYENERKNNLNILSKLRELADAPLDSLVNIQPLPKPKRNNTLVSQRNNIDTQTAPTPAPRPLRKNNTDTQTEPKPTPRPLRKNNTDTQTE